MAIKVIALSQTRRGHGVSTAAYFLACDLADLKVPVLIMNVTGRNATLTHLNAHLGKRNVVVWTPPSQGMHMLPIMLRQAKQQIANMATCIVLDIDMNQIEQQFHGDDARAIDYLIMASGNTPEEIHQTGAAVEGLNHFLAIDHLGIAYSRISLEQAQDIPHTTEEQSIPIIGYWPADFLLAVDPDLNNAQSMPHETYLQAIHQLAQRLKNRLRLETR